MRLPSLRIAALNTGTLSPTETSCVGPNETAAAAAATLPQLQQTTIISSRSVCMAESRELEPAQVSSDGRSPASAADMGGGGEASPGSHGGHGEHAAAPGNSPAGHTHALSTAEP